MGEEDGVSAAAAGWKWQTVAVRLNCTIDVPV